MSVASFYPTISRDMFCTQNKQDGRFCLPSVLENVEARSGEKITVSGVISLISGKLTRADRAFLSIPKVCCGNRDSEVLEMNI
jgi:hypothetical protein